MAFHDELLGLAIELVNRNPASPNQADLRRGISCAYYALYHLADYDMASAIARGHAVTEVIRAEIAFLDWDAVRTHPAAHEFLAELLCSSMRKR